jgi:hypothetical protein
MEARFDLSSHNRKTKVCLVGGTKWNVMEWFHTWSSSLCSVWKKNGMERFLEIEIFRPDAEPSHSTNRWNVLVPSPLIADWKKVKDPPLIPYLPVPLVPPLITHG